VDRGQVIFCLTHHYPATHGSHAAWMVRTTASAKSGVQAEHASGWAVNYEKCKATSKPLGGPTRAY